MVTMAGTGNWTRGQRSRPFHSPSANPLGGLAAEPQGGVPISGSTAKTTNPREVLRFADGTTGAGTDVTWVPLGHNTAGRLSCPILKAALLSLFHHAPDIIRKVWVTGQFIERSSRARVIQSGKRINEHRTVSPMTPICGQSDQCVEN
jgi:hypothetical protein